LLWPTAAVDKLMAFDAQRDQVFEAFMPELTPQLEVMNLQLFDCAAILTAPSIPPKNLPAKILVRLGCQRSPRLFGSQPRHGIPVIACNSFCCCALGNKL
jgi:hypothetical protein